MVSTICVAIFLRDPRVASCKSKSKASKICTSVIAQSTLTTMVLTCDCHSHVFGGRVEPSGPRVHPKLAAIFLFPFFYVARWGWDKKCVASLRARMSWHVTMEWHWTARVNARNKVSVNAI